MVTARFLLITVFAAVASPLSAEPLKEGNAAEATARPALEELKAFSLPEGFTMELVASEETGLPKPVMVSFDDAGRLWSVTATEYPRDQEPGIWQKTGKDRVVVMDHPLLPYPGPVRIFAEGMMMPLSVLPYGKGAFVAQGPEILFLEDTDGDGKADVRKVLVKGFGVQDTHTLPHQLTRMPGGRIVFSQGVLNSGTVTDAAGRAFDFRKTLIASMKPDGTDMRVIGAGLNNIWAWAHTRTGGVFIQEANDFGYSIVPFEEDTSYPSFFETKLHPASPWHPPTAPGLDLGGTGFSGLALCDDRAGSPSAPWQGLFMVANPVMGKIHMVKGSQAANGVWSFSKQGDLVTCQDPMFRPVAVTFGPDGCLYITDWYNRIISHNEVARDHPARDKERGRIWRVRHRSQSVPVIPDLAIIPAELLPARLAADNTWDLRRVWHQIVERRDRAAVPGLVKILSERTLPEDAQVHALWCLEELGFYEASLWRKLVTHPSAGLRREAVRALSTLKVPEAEGFEILQPLAGETAWTVRYEVLRYFRRAAGPVNAGHLTWLRQWSTGPAPREKVNGWNGPFPALGGAYERAFQDFLLKLAETKSGAAMAAESKWDKVIGSKEAPSNPLAVNARLALVKKALPAARAPDGQALVESICLQCHSLGGKGAGFAPPLDGSGSRDLDGLLTAIVDPDAAAENVFRLYRIEKKDGTLVEGFKKREDEKEITLFLMGGLPQVVPVAEIKVAGYISGRSMMPDLTAGMTPEQVASMVAWLRSGGK